MTNTRQDRAVHQCPPVGNEVRVLRVRGGLWGSLSRHAALEEAAPHAVLDLRDNSRGERAGAEKAHRLPSGL